ncbi:YciI family protein [Actinomadura spongiicola]|uniref:YciI family protein n=1 Tax=Actinomadura spongiicola TaxID=2303421 RepID=UPI001313F0F8|nr:YciI family protein [Actinomadura spongiicola]
MKFSLLYQYDPSKTGPTEGEIADWLAFDKDMRDAGVFVYAVGYHAPEPSLSRTVTIRDGSTNVTPGVTDHPGDVPAGLCVIDVPDIEAATEWAARVPTARYGSVEIRTNVEYEG